MPASPVVLERRRARGRKALKIAAFSVCLVLVVIAALAILARFAGGWGVPFFPYTTDRGSSCVNTFTGFRCDKLDLADVNYFADLELPANTKVLNATYVSTHDYQLNATLALPNKGSGPAIVELRDAFGTCDAGHPSPLSSGTYSSLCVMANDNDVAESGVPDSRIFVVATGVRKDDLRLISLNIRSR